MDFIESPRPFKWLLVYLVQPRFYCQDEARHAFIAKTVAAILSLPILGQPCFHRQDDSSHDCICQRQGQLRFHRREGASHIFIAKTGAVTLSSPRRGQPCFHCHDGQRRFFCRHIHEILPKSITKTSREPAKMPQELSVDGTKPLGISTLDNYAQWGCISRTAPYRSQCAV